MNYLRRDELFDRYLSTIQISSIVPASEDEVKLYEMNEEC